ncbi:DUF6602 domain-containing protein [Paenibacillus sp. LHD-38]|uniref:DUF6602 domain-containing protein n=1 Tax=Paenibacillus sp. LHD-38 TaxID=3072143 RepID=UPI00280CC141|nr:DUF6602 domain-containing protein [Paenibacillus sp. LHD-38]MDQ8738246.1 hypothetical protein [Paenibacillus sp. LHD-38]
MSLENTLLTYQKMMELQLEDIREKYNHKGNKRSNVENIIRDFLKEYLPPSNRIGQGEIVDTDGKVSNQTDIIITNEYHPFINENLHAPARFFIEGVSCVGEVKSILNSADLIEILKNCKKFKELKITFDGGTEIRMPQNSDVDRYVKRRPYFLFAFESQLTLETIKNKIDEYNQENNIRYTEQIDGIFLLDRGYIINVADGEGSIVYRNEDGSIMEGFVPVSKDINEKILVGFLSWIHIVTPRIMMYQSFLTKYL